VPLWTIQEFLINYSIYKIRYLQLDTEGHDCVILHGLFDYLDDKPKDYFPEKIQFESNAHTPANDVDKLIQRATQVGYIVVSRGHDTILVHTKNETS